MPVSWGKKRYVACKKVKLFRQHFSEKRVLLGLKAGNLRPWGSKRPLELEFGRFNHKVLRCRVRLKLKANFNQNHYPTNMLLP